MLDGLKALFNILKSVLTLLAPIFILWALASGTYSDTPNTIKLLSLVIAFVFYLFLGSTIESVKEFIGPDNRDGNDILNGLLIIHFITVVILIAVLGLICCNALIMAVPKVLKIAF